MATTDLDNRFDHHAPDQLRARKHEGVRAVVKAAADAVVKLTPPGREQALALTKLEEAMFWANAAIARD